MLENALKKLNDEIEKSKDNQYIKVVGEFLINHIQNNSGQADKIMVDNKTIEGSIKAMTDEARKKQKNNMAMFTDQEGFAIVLKYFEINGTVENAAPAPTKPAPANMLDISLDDLL